MRRSRAQAEVDAEAERDVVLVGAHDVQAVGLREALGVAIGRADRGDHQGVAGNRAGAGQGARCPALASARAILRHLPLYARAIAARFA
jgi:hypothetical protein